MESKKLTLGLIDKLKSRVVAKRFDQTHGFDFNKNFSPIVKQVTMRVIITIALSKGWALHKLDVNNAFLI